MIKSPLAKRLKEARVAADLSQKKLGIAAGMDEFTSSARMNQYETGKHVPDYVTLKQIVKVLKVPVAYFYAEDQVLAELMILYFRLSKSRQEKILSYASGLER